MEENYDNFLKSPWCPLFGDLSDFNEIRYTVPDSQVTRCVDIVERSRKLWGIYPRDTTFTNWPEEKDIPIRQTNISPFVTKDPKELYQYPFWKVEEARKIARSNFQVNQYILEPMGQPSPTPDIAWEKALDIVRNRSMQGVDEKITDSEILAVLAIEEAYAVLIAIIEYFENEDDSYVLKRVQIASGLLAKAQELESKKIIKGKEQILKNKEDDIGKKDITITALEKALTEKQNAIHYSETKDDSRFLFNDKGYSVTIDKKEYEFGNKEREYKFLKKLYDNLDEYIIDDDLAEEIGLDSNIDEFETILTKIKSKLMKILTTHNISILRRKRKVTIDGAYKLVLL